jgi:hypothetical protein
VFWLVTAAGWSEQERQVRERGAAGGIWGYSSGNVRVERATERKEKTCGARERVSLKECMRVSGRLCSLVGVA